ncbi:MAG: hypothetical protein K8T90_07130 [Planctomycetes bacterium]|nr:hypothetical protein [Planctomycetota bacterium]
MDNPAPRQHLADLGVGLFRPAPFVRRPAADEYADLVVALATSSDPRLVASLPCLFALHDDGAAAAATAAAARLDPAAVARLGLAYRLARALIVSRDPDLRHVLGRSRRLPPIPIEPTDLPSPNADFGERCLSIARELHDTDPGGNPVIDFVDLFITWLRLAETDHLAIVDA